MITIAICNQKGGVGKTTTASALSAGLTRRGYKILTIDSDPQANLTASAGLDPDEAPSLENLYFQTKSFEEVIQETALGDFIPCSLSLSDADRKLTHHGAFRLLKNILNKQKENYDFCVIDAPPSLGILSLNILVASDKIIIPVNAAAFSLQGIQSLNRIIDEVKVDNPTLMIQGILITRSNPRTNLNKDVTEVLKEIAKTINTRLFETTIRQGVAIETAQADHLDIFTAAPKSGVAKDYDSFIDEFLGEKP